MRNAVGNFFNTTARKARKVSRFIFGHKNAQAYRFAIVCVKRTPYAVLTINNINSLHYLNSSHEFVIYCDDTCETELQRLWHKFDYPKRVKINNVFKSTGKSWQYYKIETIIDASKNGMVLIDADGLWHKDPVVNKNKITFQVSPLKIKEKKEEFEIVKRVFNKPEWGEFRYYTSAFVSIPQRYMTDKVASDARNYLNILFNHDYNFLENQKERDEQKRQSEQFAVNLALLTNYASDTFAVLKKEDGPKNRDFVQPLYYGCSNRILE
jgi:hypothetical protein